MKYFILSQDLRVKGPPVPAEMFNPLQRIFSIEEAEEFEEAMAFSVNNKEGWEYPAVLDRPIFLVDSMVKNVFSKYDRKIIFNGVMLNDFEHKEQNLYWLMGVQVVDCLSSNSEFYGGSRKIKTLVLDESKIQNYPIFKVGGLLEQYLIIRLDVAESLLRREIYGFELKAVQTDRGV
jgi:hypothetical protein